MSELKPTTEESIRHFEAQQKRYVREHNGKPCPHYANAIEALHRAQPANEPLTLGEMNALDHEPIYVLHTGGKWTMNGWHIATASSYQNHGRCDLEIDNGNTTIDMQNYGKTWLAYGHKQGGEQE